MAFRISTNLSPSAGASRSRGTFPMSCYRDPQHFAMDLFSNGDPAEERVHVVV
jgi:hypothetical protein